MKALSEKHPDVLAFKSGNFMAHQNRYNLSAFALNQSHEQNNTIVKGFDDAEIPKITAEFEKQAINQ